MCGKLSWQRVVQGLLFVVGRQPNLRISDGSLSAVSKPGFFFFFFFYSFLWNRFFVSEYSFCNMFQVLQYLHISAPFQIQHLQMFALLCKYSVNFRDFSKVLMNDDECSLKSATFRRDFHVLCAGRSGLPFSRRLTTTTNNNTNSRGFGMLVSSGISVVP